jgi:DsbC/DsbD-like thiol-disulfide interchange protein
VIRTSHLFAILVAGLGLAWVSAPASAGLSGPGDLGGTGSHADAVRARLIPESPTVAPGGTVLLGVHLEQQPGWHTYWKNGGDSGLPTTVSWTLPEGYSIGPLQWPTPHRYEEAGGLVAYGYTDDVLLLAELTAPAQAKAGEHVVVQAKVDWLMCKDLCIPGSAVVSATLAIGEPNGPVSSEDAALFAAAKERLPRPPSAYGDLRVETALELTAVPPGQRVHAAVRIEGLQDPRGTQWVWFPAPPDVVFPEPAFSTVSDRGALVLGLPLQVDASATPGKPLVLDSVVELEEPGHPARFVQVSIPMPSRRRRLRSSRPFWGRARMRVCSTHSLRASRLPRVRGGRSGTTCCWRSWGA